MNIKILDSFLKEYVKTKATPQKIGELLSLSSVSVEKIEKYKDDFIYDIEITTNRPDLMGAVGLAREVTAILKQNGIEAEFISPKLEENQTSKINLINIKSDSKLTKRICAVVMEVDVKKSPNRIQERLETSGVRSLNNLIDITNYVMKTIGHPTHVFDFDKLKTKNLSIELSKKGEKIKTLDNKEFVLNGEEIVAVDDMGKIVDLLGIMGLANSVVSNSTKRILFFVNNNAPERIRKASMSLGIRSEAAVLNEKGLDPKATLEALLYGIKLYKEFANGKVISEIIDVFDEKPKEKYIEVSLEQINKTIGIEINTNKALTALTNLGFNPKLENNKIKVIVPSFRLLDIGIEEDIIEEIARIYGYQNLPSVLPMQSSVNPYIFTDDFYWEVKAKKALKYWGFTETYTYSFVSEDMFEGPLEMAVEIANPLIEDFVYMRNSLIPSLLKVVFENKKREEIKIFELANIYVKNREELPNEILMLSGVIKKKNANFYEVKGIIEQLLFDLGIKNILFKTSRKGGMGAGVFVEEIYLGEIEVLDRDLINFELNFHAIIKHASSKKEYKSFAKYPPIIEDLSLIADANIKTEDLIKKIKAESNLITDVSLNDTYLSSRTFRIVYQDQEKNLTKEDVSTIRSKIISSLEKDFAAQIK